MKNFYLFAIVVSISSITFAQSNNVKNDTLKEKVIKLEKAPIQPKEVSKSNIQQKEVEETKKTNPENINSGNNKATINRRKIY
jgi:hypothetical protein